MERKGAMNHCDMGERMVSRNGVADMCSAGPRLLAG